MNAVDPAADHDPRPEPSEPGDTLHRVPGLSDADLPFPGLRRIREHLMREAAPTPRRPSRTRRPAAVLLAAGATACAVVLAVTVGGRGSEGRGPVAGPPEPAAVRLLDRVAVAARALPAPTLRDDQFVYTRTTGHSTALTETASGAMAASRTDESAERWLSVDGSAESLVRTASGTSRSLPTARARAPPAVPRTASWNRCRRTPANSWSRSTPTPAATTVRARARPPAPARRRLSPSATCCGRWKPRPV